MLQLKTSCACSGQKKEGEETVKETNNHSHRLHDNKVIDVTTSNKLPNQCRLINWISICILWNPLGPGWKIVNSVRQCPVFCHFKIGQSMIKKSKSFLVWKSSLPSWLWLLIVNALLSVLCNHLKVHPVWFRNGGQTHSTSSLAKFIEKRKMHFLL